MSKKIKFVYWKVAARAQAAMLMLDAKNIDYEWDFDTANKWPSTKSQMPFGQLPVMYNEDGKIIAQSGSITRYCAKLARLLPDMPLQCAQTEMVMDHTDDIFNAMAKCKYAGDNDKQIEAWSNFKTKILPEKLSYLNDLLTETFYGGDTINAADICVFSIISLVVRAGIRDCLMNFKKLYDLYINVYMEGNIKNYIKQNPEVYFKYMEKKREVLPMNH